jgi:hypothetical protein
MENSFKSVIDQSKSILILLPTKPYFDQVAAGLSLYLALRNTKQVQVSSPSEMTVEFNRLIGVNKITSELGNKNLVIKFADYKASDIERVSYDIEDGQFRLSVIPKQNIEPPDRSQVNLLYSGVSADTVILVGGASENHFPAISTKELTGAKLVHIGTRDISLSSKNPYISFSRPAASVSEVVYSLIKESGLKVDEDMATNLLMGIEEATSNFTNPEVKAETFMSVSELMQAGGKRSAAPKVQESYPAGSIPGQKLTVQNPNQAGNQSTQENPQQKNPATDETPKEWLQPKVYKGTSIS